MSRQPNGSRVKPLHTVCIRPASATHGSGSLGPSNETKDSLHTDIWKGPTVELAQRGVLAVYPVTGWWKLRKQRDRSEQGARYALVVSIETPEQDVDIWTPVAQEVGIPIEVEH